MRRKSLSFGYRFLNAWTLPYKHTKILGSSQDFFGIAQLSGRGLCHHFTRVRMPFYQSWRLGYLTTYRPSNTLNRSNASATEPLEAFRKGLGRVQAHEAVFYSLEVSRTTCVNFAWHSFGRCNNELSCCRVFRWILRQVASC